MQQFVHEHYTPGQVAAYASSLDFADSMYYMYHALFGDSHRDGCDGRIAEQIFIC